MAMLLTLRMRRVGFGLLICPLLGVALRVLSELHPPSAMKSSGLYPWLARRRVGAPREDTAKVYRPSEGRTHDSMHLPYPITWVPSSPCSYPRGIYQAVDRRGTFSPCPTPPGQSFKMGNILKKIFGNKEMRILMLGLDAAGKTSTSDLLVGEHVDAGWGTRNIISARASAKIQRIERI